MSINVNSAQASAGLLLVPMFIPGWRPSVQPPGLAHGGIPQSIYQVPNGLALVIDPVTMLTSFVLAAFDTVEVWLNGKATSVSKVILPGEEQLRILLYLPQGRLVNGVNKLFYRVTRPSGNYEDSTPVLDVLYHDPAPGNPAPAGVTIVFPPNIVTGGVGPAEAAAGVLVTFIISFARPFDVIRLDVGTWSTTITVSDPSKPITVTLTAADFLKIGDNANTPVKCTVTDQLGNGNQSSTTYLDIHANRLDLLAPTVKGQTGNNFNPTLQDVRVLVPKGSLLPTDTMSVAWQGAISTPEASFTSPKRLVSAGLEVVGPRSVLAYSLGKTVTVTYVIDRNGKSTPSQPLSLNILTLPATALISPKIVEADANNVLDVMALGTSNATVHALLHTLIEDGQPCWLSVEGTKADGTAHNVAPWNGLPAQVNKQWVAQGFWPHALANSYLKQLGDSTTLRIKYKVSMDKSNNPATAVVFPDRTYTIKSVALVVPVIISVQDPNGLEIPSGGSTAYTTVTLSGTATPGTKIDLVNYGNVLPGTEIQVDGSGNWRFQLTGLTVASYNLRAKRKDGAVSGARDLKVVAAVIPIKTISVPYCRRLAIHPKGTHAYVTSLSNDGYTSTVTVIDTETQRVAKVITTDYAWPIAVTPDNNHVYYRSGNATVTVINAANYSLIRTLPVTSVSLGDIGFSPDGTRAYFCGPSNGINQLSIIDTKTFQTIKTITLQRNTGFLAVSPDAKRVYVSNPNGEGSVTGSVSVIDATSLNLIKHIDVGSNPGVVRVSPDGKFVYVLRYGRLLVVIDTQTLAVIRNVTFEADAWSFVLSADGKFMYVSVGRKIMKVDTLNFNPVPIFEKEGFGDMALTQDGKFIYCTRFSENSVYVIAIS